MLRCLTRWSAQVCLAAALPPLAHGQAHPECIAPVAPALNMPLVLGNGNAGSVTPAQLQTALDGGGAIRLNIGNSTLALTQQLRITRATTLDLAGATLSGQNQTRIFDISNPALSADYTFNLLNAQLMAGNASTAPGDALARSGGALLNDHGGEPWRAVRVRLFNVAIRNSVAVASAQDGGGGAIYMVGLKELTLVGSTLEGNSGSNGGGLYSLGSEIVALYDSVVRANQATGTGGNPGNGGNGGGIGVDGATRQLRLCRVTLQDNQAQAFGGGLFTTVYDQTSFTRIEDSLIAGNASLGASQHTGGVYLQGGPFSIRGSTFHANQGAGNGGLALFDHGNVVTSGEIVNSSFVANRARTGLGGAMGISATGTLLLQNLTLADNIAECAVCFAGGIANSAGLSITLRNTIFRNNTGGNAFNPWAMLHPVSGSHTLQWPQTRPGSGGQQEARVTPSGLYADALLGPLGNSGGLTPTLPLLSGSPALDTGTSTGTPSVDQRGLPRDAQPDIGAWERQGELPLYANGFE